MNKKIAILFTLVLGLTITQSTVSAQEQGFRQTYVDFSSYTETLQDKIITNWSPKTRKKQRNAVVLVKVDKDGTIENINVLKSSNKKKFDNEITDSIRRSVPLEALPSNSQAEYKNIQIDFLYNKTKNKKASPKHVIANVNNQEGSEQYLEQIDNVIGQKLDSKSYFFKKDSIFEMNINKAGKLTYVKVKNPSKKACYLNKEFDRNTLTTLQNTSFPAIPEELGINNLQVDYRVLTQRKRTFNDFIYDYALNLFRTGTESFCVQSTPNL